MIPTTFADQIALRQTSPNEFVTLFYPQKMGNTADIAYGGCAVAVAVTAAYRTIDPKYYAYSLHGNFLGPAVTVQPLYASVRHVRDSKSFATREVEISQELPDGGRRACLLVVADFMTRENNSVLTYSAPPSIKYTPAEDCPPLAVSYENLIRKGVHPKKIAVHKVIFGLMSRYIEGRWCPESVSAQNLIGIAKELPTTQDDQPLTSKTTADWLRLVKPTDSVGEQMAALSFALDGGLSFIPLTHNKQFIDDVGACSSLDFALRIFSSDINMNDWLLREVKTITGGDGRTFSEARVWDRNGKMVASASQQSIMRPKPVKKSSL